MLTTYDTCAIHTEFHILYKNAQWPPFDNRTVKTSKTFIKLNNFKFEDGVEQPVESLCRSKLSQVNTLNQYCRLTKETIDKTKLNCKINGFVQKTIHNERHYPLWVLSVSRYMIITREQEI